MAALVANEVKQERHFRNVNQSSNLDNVLWSNPDLNQKIKQKWLTYKLVK